MKLILNPKSSRQLHDLYRGAFTHARELYVVSAYLTKWDKTLPCSRNCRIRILIGTDFGITRKSACKEVLEWLPPNQKNCFFAADFAPCGFHPKAIFWQDDKRAYHILVGSSNLTEAAFETNYEANIYSQVNAKTFNEARDWVDGIIESESCEVDLAWLKNYRERPLGGNKNFGGRSPAARQAREQFPLPTLPVAAEREIAHLLQNRRRQITAFETIQKPLRKLFRVGAAKELTNKQIWHQLLKTWGSHQSRFQGKGLERTGANSNFQLFSAGLADVLDATETNRDEVVIDTLDEFARNRLSTRRALFSEMLCHFFPDRYPLVNGPVQLWIKDMKYRAPKGASEGAKYIDMASRMRMTLRHNQFKLDRHKVKNLAELDVVIWASYEEQYRRQRLRYQAP